MASESCWIFLFGFRFSLCTRFVNWRWQLSGQWAWHSFPFNCTWVLCVSFFFFERRERQTRSCLWHLPWFLSISKCYSILFLCRPRRHFLFSASMEEQAQEEKDQSDKLPHTITKDKRFPLRIFNRNLRPYFVWQNFMAFAFRFELETCSPLPPLRSPLRPLSFVLEHWACPLGPVWQSYAAPRFDFVAYADWITALSVLFFFLNTPIPNEFLYFNSICFIIAVQKSGSL